MKYITVIPFTIVMLLVFYVYAKAIFEEDAIIRNRATSLMIVAFIDIFFIICSLNYESSTIFLIFIIEIIFSIGSSLWIMKTNKFEIEYEKYLCYCFLEEDVKVSPENIKKFKKKMTREEQIRFLRSLSYIDIDVEQTTEMKENGMKTIIKKETEVIVPLIETDEDIEEWEPILKKTKNN